MAIDQVIKRDGRRVPFDRKRIENAIYAAARAVGNGEGRQWAETLSWAVTGILEERFGQEGRTPHVEEIQDIVEEVLIKSGHPQVAKAYILYRQKRAEARAAEQMLLDTTKLVDDYLDQTDWRVSENSNMNYSLQGLNFYLASSIAARYWLHKIYPPEVQRAHIEGDFHIHDLGMLSAYTYCGQEVVVFKDKAGIRLVSFEQLYAACTEPEVCLNPSDGAFAKYPQEGFVLDKGGWTRVVRLVRKRKTRPMRFLRSRGGRSVIVTDNHPMITRDRECPAAVVTPHSDALYAADVGRLLAGENLFSEKEIDLLVHLRQAGVTKFGRDPVYFNGVPINEWDIEQAGEGVIHTSTRTIPRRIPLTADFGYFVGSVLAARGALRTTRGGIILTLTRKEADVLHAIHRPLVALGIPGWFSRRDGSDRYELRIYDAFLGFLFEHVLGIQPGPRYSGLPARILHYDLDFVRGVLAGILDGDGSGVGADARTLLEQIAYVAEVTHASPLRQDGTRGDWDEVLSNDPIDIPDSEIYDITTESGTLIVNGMWHHNCTGWDLQDLLIRGFGGVPSKVESRPPRHLRTALGQLVNFFYTVQGEVAGAVAVSNFDTLLAPFIRYDRLDEAGVRQAVQEFIFNINTPTRVGFQTPFTNLTMDLIPPPTLRDQPVIIGGKPQEATYGEFQREMDLLNRTFAEVMLEGDARGRVFSVDYGASVPVRENGTVRWVRIGEYIDGKMATARPERKDRPGLNPTLAEVLDVHFDIETIGILNGQVGWYKVRYLVRHPADRLLKIATAGGFNVLVTPSHSVLVLRNGEIVACEAGGLQRGEYLLSPRTSLLKRLGIAHTWTGSSPKGKRRIYRQNFRNRRLARHRHRTLGKIPIVASGLGALLEAMEEREAGYRDINHSYRNSPGRIKARYGIRQQQKTTSLEKARRIIADAERMGIPVPQGLRSLVNSDLLYLPVRAISEQKATNGWVYDFCTEADSFLANQILVHNTFPIPTYNITRDFRWENPALEPVWGMTARYGIPYFGNYVNSDMRPEDARSMCPLHPDTPVVVRAGRDLDIRAIKDVYSTGKEARCEVLFAGDWHPARVVATPTQGCVEFTLGNGEKVAMDVRHEQPVKRGRGRPIEILTADQVREGMYLPFNATPINEDRDNYEAGFSVGAFLGSGTYDGATLVFSLKSGEKEAEVAWRLREFFTRCGFSVQPHPQKGQGAGPSPTLLRVGSSGDAVGSGYTPTRQMAQFVEGRSPAERGLTPRAFQMGQSFLRGVLDGWYATDGDSPGRILMVSERLCRDFAVLCGLLGYGYTIDRQGDIRDNRHSQGPVFTARFYERPPHRQPFFYEDGFWWYPVESVRALDYRGPVFCFVVDSEEHLFQTANGLVTHNCRLRLDNRELRRRPGGLFAAAPLTGSVGVVTINMPRLAYLAEDEDEFFRRLEHLMEVARTSLEIKRKVLEHLTERGLYPYSRHYLEAVKGQSGAYWSNHFSTIGLIGMNEACLNLLGVDIAHPEGKALAIRTLNFMRQVLARFQEETGNLYNLEATPAEGASYRLARADRKRYPNIRTAGTPETPYYTNSTFLPVSYSDDLFEVLEHQDDLQTLYTGGTVLHIFLGERLHDGNQARRLVRLITENYRLPYFTITPTFSICPIHGYIPGEHFFCPYEHTAEELARYGVSTS